MVNVIGFIANRAIAEREGVGADRATQLGLIGSVVGGPGLSPVGLVLTQTIARREAPSRAPGTALIEVPDVVGRDATEATDLLTALGLSVNRDDEESGTVAIGQVISQRPTPGARLTPGDPITLVVSIGVRVPRLVGLTAEAASTILRDRGLVPVTVERPSDAVRPGFVLAQDPAAEIRASAGAHVTITVSLGPGTIVPDVVGLKFEAAEETLRRVGLRATRVDEDNPAFQRDFVFAQDPLAESAVRPDATVTLRVSTGNGTGVRDE